MAITETWVDTANKIFLPEYEIDGYQMFHKDRRDRRGGGVTLYVKDTLKCSAINSVQTGGDSESVWVDINKGKDKLTLGVLYRPPNLSRQDTDILLQEVGRVSRNKHICIMGDFNYRNID